MDLIRQMMINREAKGVTSNKPLVKEAPMTKDESFKGGMSFSERRKEIIKNKPKKKVVREYFIELIERECESDSDSD